LQLAPLASNLHCKSINPGIVTVPTSIGESAAITTLDRLPASIARFDRALRIVYANARLVAQLGVEAKKVLGRTCLQLGMTAEAWGDWKPTLRAVFDSGLANRFEYLSSGNHGERFVQVWIEPEFDKGGAVESVLAFAVTNNKVQDLRVSLQTQTDLFTTFMDNGRIFAWMRNEAGKYVYANSPYLKILGLSADDLYGKTVDDRWPPDVAERFRANDAKVLASGQPIEVLEPATDTDGNPCTWLNVKFPFRSPDGRTYVGGIGIDVTKYLLLEEKNQAFERQLNYARKLEQVADMSAGVAHEFNNLLTTMLGNVSLARMNPGGDENLAKIEAAALRAAKLCEHLINYCGRGQREMKEVNLNSLLAELPELTKTIIHPPVALTIHPPMVPVLVRGEIFQLRQALLHLITNAVEALPGHGSITVATGLIAIDKGYLGEAGLSKQLMPGTYAYLEVTDTGRGMSEATLSRIFEPFFTTKVPAPTGLGLSAVQGIVREHQGGIVVRSQPGRGSRFLILLPALATPTETTAPADPTPTPAPVKTPTHNLGRGRVILVIDDEPEVRSIASRALTAAGFQVRVAEDGQAGLEVFRTMPLEVSAVLLDLTMPRLGGPGAFRELKRMRSDLKVILTSGYAPEDATSVFTPEDLAGFLRKPFRPEDLIAAVEAAIGP